jgi:lipopolysaccharide export system permease protein
MATARISRYVLKEITVPTIVAMVIFCFVLVMGRLLKLVELVVNKGVPILEILSLFTHLLPTFFIIIIPFSLFLGILIGFGRLSAESEIIALKSGGVSLFSLIKPVLLLGIIGSLLVGWLSVYAQPSGRHAFDQKIFRLANEQIGSSIRPGIFNTDFDNLIIYTGSLDEVTGEMRDVFISDNRSAQSPVIITASKGLVLSDPETLRMTLRLERGNIHRRKLEAGNENYQAARFGSYDLNLSLDKGSGAGTKRPKKINRMTFSEIQLALTKNHDTKTLNAMQTEIHERFSLSLAPLVFAILGVPLGIQSTRSGKGGGFAKALGITLIYYALLTTARTAGHDGLLPPFVAMWIPNGLMLSGGVYLFLLHARERRLEWLDRITYWIDDTFTRVLARKNRPQ